MKKYLDLYAGSGKYGDSLVVGSQDIQVISVEDKTPFDEDRIKYLASEYPNEAYYSVPCFLQKIQGNHRFVIQNPIDYLREFNSVQFNSISLCFPSYGTDIKTIFDLIEINNPEVFLYKTTYPIDTSDESIISELKNQEYLYGGPSSKKYNR